MKKIIKWEILKTLKQSGFVAIAGIGLAMIALVMLGEAVMLVLDAEINQEWREKSPYFYVTDQWVESYEKLEQEAFDEYYDTNMTEVFRQSIEIRYKNSKDTAAFLRYLRDNKIKVYLNHAIGNIEMAAQQLDESHLDGEYNVMCTVRDIAMPMSDGILVVIPWETQSVIWTPSGDFDIEVDIIDGTSVTSVLIYSEGSDVSDRMPPFVGLFQLFAILTASAFFAQELSKGSIKQVLLKPVPRIRVATCKLLSAAIVLVGFWFLGSIIYLVLGAALDLFLASSTSTFVLWFGSGFAMPNTVVRLLLCLDGLLGGITFLVLGCFASVLTKSNIASVLLPLAFFAWTAGVLALFPNYAYLDLTILSAPLRNYAFGITEYACHSVVLSLFTLVAILSGFVALTLRSFKRFDYDKSATKRESL